MKKSELRQLIREVLKEELENRKQLKESVDVLDVSASEVDDLAHDVFIDAEFDAAYKADGYTVGDAVNQLIVDVISYEYPNTDLGRVPERVSDALSNMLDSGLLG
jgi:hypothetical protein